MFIRETTLKNRKEIVRVYRGNVQVPEGTSSISCPGCGKKVSLPYRHGGHTLNGYGCPHCGADLATGKKLPKTEEEIQARQERQVYRPVFDRGTQY